MSLSGTQYYANAREIYGWWLARGQSHVFACGMLANAQGESSLDPLAVGDHGGAFGLYQLHLDRVKIIRDGNKIWKGCGIDISKLPNIAIQLEGVWWELQHSEHGALAQILAATTVYAAAAACSAHYERPQMSQAARRGVMAQTWDKFFAAEAAT